MSGARQTWNLGNAQGGGVLFVVREDGAWTLRLAQTRNDQAIPISAGQAEMLAT
jgi:hypothetical protein